MIPTHQMVEVAIQQLARAQDDDAKLLHSRLEVWLATGKWLDKIGAEATPEAAYKVAVAEWQAEHYPVSVGPIPPNGPEETVGNRNGSQFWL